MEMRGKCLVAFDLTLALDSWMLNAQAQEPADFFRLSHGFVSSTATILAFVVVNIVLSRLSRKTSIRERSMIVVFVLYSQAQETAKFFTPMSRIAV